MPDLSRVGCVYDALCRVIYRHVSFTDTRERAPSSFRFVSRGQPYGHTYTEEGFVVDIPLLGSGEVVIR